jgi:hypothetical protein
LFKKSKKETRVPVFFVTFATGKKTKMAKRERKEEKKNFIRHLFPFFFINEKKRNISFQSCFWRCRLTLSLSHASKAKQSKATICR